MLARAQDALIAYEKKPAAPSNRKVVTALKKHFNWTEALMASPSPGEVRVTPDYIPGKAREYIRTLMGKISVPFGAICPANDQQREQLNPQHKGDIVKILAAALQDNTNCFMYTPDYFRQKPEFRAKVVLHEMFHSWKYMSDDSYEGDAKYPGKVGNATENPDSYACLIRDIGRR